MSLYSALGSRDPTAKTLPLPSLATQVLLADAKRIQEFLKGREKKSRKAAKEVIPRVDRSGGGAEKLIGHS